MADLFEAVEKSSIGIGLLSRGEAKAVRRLWTKRFGALTADVDAALQAASTETLEHILDQLIEPAYTVAQARKDLGLNA